MGETLKLVLNIGQMTLGLGFIIWLFIRSLRRSPEPEKLIFKWLFSLPFIVACFWLAIFLGPFGPFAIVFMAIVMSYIWVPHISETLFAPLTNLFDGGHEPPEAKPLYSVALAKRKSNHPLEAVMAIREQLAKFPNDFEGVQLLANIQAEELNDLPGAAITLNNFCNSPAAPPRQVIAALTQLADWHLKKAADVEAARAAFQQIVALFPETEAALRAEQRLAHLGETEKLILAQHDAQAVLVPEAPKNLGLMDNKDFLRPEAIDPGKLAAVYVKQLEQHPQDFDAREKLATLYARDFKRLDLATMELEKLIAEPRHSPKKITGWLNLLATFQVELGADVATVKGTLERIVELFPDSPAAEVVQRRLARINLEIQGKKETPGVKLGVYEQNIGLKYGSPRQL